MKIECLRLVKRRVGQMLVIRMAGALVVVRCDGRRWSYEFGRGGGL